MDKRKNEIPLGMTYGKDMLLA